MSVKKAKIHKLTTWAKRKTKLSLDWIDNSNHHKSRGIVQGGIYLCELGENVGSEQNSDVGADRPVIVLSNNTINSTSPNVVVAPLSKTLKFAKDGKSPRYRSNYFLMQSKYPFLTYDSAVKIEEIRALSKVRFGNQLGSVDASDLEQIIRRERWTFKKD